MLIMIIISVLLISTVNGITISNNSQSKSEKISTSDNWKNHRIPINSLYSRYREGKSNNDPFYNDPNNNDQLSINYILFVI